MVKSPPAAGEERGALFGCSRGDESAGELGEDGQVNVQPYPVDEIPEKFRQIRCPSPADFRWTLQRGRHYGRSTPWLRPQKTGIMPVPFVIKSAGAQPPSLRGPRRVILRDRLSADFD
jgi:hypothetical protein